MESQNYQRVMRLLSDDVNGTQKGSRNKVPRPVWDQGRPTGKPEIPPPSSSKGVKTKQWGMRWLLAPPPVSYQRRLAKIEDLNKIQSLITKYPKTSRFQ